MALVFNATAETISVKVYGNYFTFKPKQIKTLQDNVAHEMVTSRSEDGLVGLSPEFEDPTYKTTPEGKAAYETAEKQGVDAFIAKQRGLIYNNQVSLRRDLERANLKYDPSIEASKGELEAMRLVAKYQKSMEDSNQAKADEIKELMRKIK